MHLKKKSLAARWKTESDTSQPLLRLKTRALNPADGPAQKAAVASVYIAAAGARDKWSTQRKCYHKRFELDPVSLRVPQPGLYGMRRGALCSRERRGGPYLCGFPSAGCSLYCGLSGACRAPHRDDMKLRAARANRNAITAVAYLPAHTRRGTYTCKYTYTCRRTRALQGKRQKFRRPIERAPASGPFPPIL